MLILWLLPGRDRDRVGDRPAITMCRLLLHEPATCQSLRQCCKGAKEQRIHSSDLEGTRRSLCSCATGTTKIQSVQPTLAGSMQQKAQASRSDLPMPARPEHQHYHC